MTRILAMLFIAASLCFGEDFERIKKGRLYATECTVTTSSEVPSCAIGVPVTAPSSVKFVLDSVFVNTPATSVVFGFGGTLPTTTNVTAAGTLKRNTGEDPIAQVYSTPNSSDETKTFTFQVTPSVDKLFDMTGVVLSSVVGQRVAKVSGGSAVSGVTRFVFYWAEMSY